jgi:PAS domain S-box-containing protein
MRKGDPGNEQSGTDAAASAAPLSNAAPSGPPLLDLLTEASHELVCRLSHELTILYATPAAERVVDRPAAQLVGARLDDFCHPDDLAGLLSAFALARDADDETHAMFRFHTAGGDWRWCEAFFRDDDSPVGMRCSLLDVTRFKRIELAIERVAREWRSTFDATHDAILMLDAQGSVMRVNRATLELFSCEFQDLVGKPLESLVRDRLKLEDAFGMAKVWQERAQVRQDAELPERSIWVRSTLDPILLPGGALGGAVLFLTDITAEKGAELRLRKTLDEVRRLSSRLRDYRDQERRSIAREVHDELGHALTALKMGVAWLSKRLPEADPDALTRAAELSALIDQTVAATRRLVSRLRPPVLDDLGLDAALEWLLSDFQRNSGLAVEAELSAMPHRLRGDGATGLFHIVQEALTNVLRHAQASRVAVRWAALDDGRFRISIDDDGCGFDREARDYVSGYGLLGISERVHDLGGEYWISSEPGEGTRIDVTVPAEALQ